MAKISPFILRSGSDPDAVNLDAQRNHVLTELSEQEVERVSGASCDIHPKINSDFTLDDTWAPGSGGDFEACDD